MIHIKDLRSGLPIFKALGSEIRIRIIELLLQYESFNLNELAGKLKLTNGAITPHIKKLEESGLITISTTVGKHGIQKICYLSDDKLLVDLADRSTDNLYEVDIKIGHYVHYEATPTCGLATKESIIGEFDDPRYFADPQHIHSEIVWLTQGCLEYWIPNYLKANQQFEEIQLIMELSSEAPSYNNNWPSDIYFYLNGIELGFWTSPGDFGGKKGIFNPHWWPPHLNQYGLLKLVRVNREGSFIDGCKISGVTIEDIGLHNKSKIKFKIAVPAHAKNAGGLTVYGEHFGNYKQNIIARVLYSQRPRP
ncbi:ArsR/SmtB family transcription factor [Paenactinomyces guangxiensis]|uniref:Helix-turn-helix domain-containing protein n=1 Tax=Paenactinomyces guangxiensis TaxID=1490290 RepID=A0A7W1WNC7_9BACL|nr:MarR family transcriptional regulator [Paenactinomyces guangxiensis]MBA4493042.1 helix-turn-helix domain-containing protein [Paenactinomyces guangxiensis]MBH8590109.1 helix-turn-helix domain-containing protein [Paenactinomyces guangxiensis]